MYFLNEKSTDSETAIRCSANRSTMEEKIG